MPIPEEDEPMITTMVVGNEREDGTVQTGTLEVYELACRIGEAQTGVYRNPEQPHHTAQCYLGVMAETEPGQFVVEGWMRAAQAAMRYFHETVMTSGADCSSHPADKSKQH